MGTGLGVHREIKDIDEACALKDRGEVVVHSPARVNGGPVVRLTRHHLLLRRTENRVSENRTSGNIASGNRTSENRTSGNRTSGNRTNRTSDDSLIKEVTLLPVNIFKSNNDLL